MLDFLGSLFGAGISAGGQVEGAHIAAQSAQQINQQNIANQQWALQGGNLAGLVANAQRAGLSPLAVSGGTMSGQSVVPGQFTGEGIAGASKSLGEGITNAIQRVSQKNDRMDALQEQWIKSQIAKTDAEGGLLVSQARRAGAPGTPKPVPFPADIPAKWVDYMKEHGADFGAWLKQLDDWTGGPLRAPTGQNFDWLRQNMPDPYSVYGGG